MDRYLRDAADQLIRQYGLRATQELVDLMVLAVKAGDEVAVSRHDAILRIVESKLHDRTQRIPQMDAHPA
jgi:fructose-1,6-bisphosphatase